MHPALTGLSLICLYSATAAAAPVEATIWDFGCQHCGGAYPNSTLVADANGDLYGTTMYFQNNEFNPGFGTVYELVPPTNSGGAWSFRGVYMFPGGQDRQPQGVTLVNGSLYGTTFYGPIFQLSSPAPDQWVESTIYTLSGGADGAYPGTGLTADTTGALYGVARYGGLAADTSTGPFGCGLVFKLTPPAAGSTAWTKTTVYNFNGPDPAICPTDGASPQVAPLLGPDGNLFGTAGVVYRLTPPADGAGAGAWHKTVLSQFLGGAGANGRLARAPSGALFGIVRGGAAGTGAIFELEPPPPGSTVWNQSVLYTFQGGGDGSYPSDVVRGIHGDLYGFSDTSAGNTEVFRLAPPRPAQTNWTFHIVTTFIGPNGSGTDFTTATLLTAPGHTFYGVTSAGGAGGAGVVFQLSP